MYLADTVHTAFLDAFHAQKILADKAIAQVSDADLRRAPDENTNSIAVIMKHVAGNLISRFTDFLTTDGEKPWRNRDDEFVDSFSTGSDGRAQILAAWEGGWHTLFDTLGQMRGEHMDWQVFIRGEPYYVPGALSRSLAHTSYHVGQIVLTSRLMARSHWTTITIPRGQSRQFNASLGFNNPDNQPQ